MSKFTVTTLQQGRFIHVEGGGIDVELTRTEAIQLQHILWLETARPPDADR